MTLHLIHCNSFYHLKILFKFEIVRLKYFIHIVIILLMILIYQIVIHKVFMNQNYLAFWQKVNSYVFLTITFTNLI